MTEVNVSIIIPTYNVAPYIRKCLDSVAAQTYTGSVECLIVDDCGPDNSIQIAEEFIREYSGSIIFRIIHRAQNGGLSAARNSGIREAKGEYLYFLDSDDYITPDCIQSMWQMVERFLGVECVFAGANVIGAEYKWMDYTKKELPEYTTDRNWLQESMLKRFKLSMTAWNRLISSDFVHTNNLYFEEGYIHEDELWNLAISQVITNAAFVKANTYNYIVRQDSIMTGAKKNKELALSRRLKVYRKMINKAKGYRRGIQSYRIICFSLESLEHITSLSDWIRYMNIYLNAMFKTDSTHIFKIIHICLACNKIFAKRFIKRLF